MLCAHLRAACRVVHVALRWALGCCAKSGKQWRHTSSRTAQRRSTSGSAKVMGGLSLMTLAAGPSTAVSTRRARHSSLMCLAARASPTPAKNVSMHAVHGATSLRP